MVYSAKKPGIAPRLKWRADVQSALTCPELALALRAFDAHVLWDALRRPADEGKWAGAEVLARRPGGPLRWHYLLRGGPPGLPEARHEPSCTSVCWELEVACAVHGTWHKRVRHRVVEGVPAAQLLCGMRVPQDMSLQKAPFRKRALQYNTLLPGTRNSTAFRAASNVAQ